jgi:TetR/AcrR family transcriptional regulator, tetracycline repressor protein
MHMPRNAKHQEADEARSDDRSDARASRDSGRAQRRITPEVSGQLTRARIVSAALELVDSEGLSALSMRKLGARLGVDPMAIYYYIPNKDALLDAIVEAVMAEVDLSVDVPSAPAEERIVNAARSYRDALLAHASALPIVLSRGPATPGAMRPVELLLGILRDAGLSPVQAMAGMNAIASTVRGTTGMAAERSEPRTAEEFAAMAEQFPAETFPYLREATMCTPDFLDKDFEFGIRALARGLLGSV